MYFISDIKKLDAKKIHRVVKYFAAPSMRLIFIEQTPLEGPSLKVVLPHGMMSSTIPLTECQAATWRRYVSAPLRVLGGREQGGLLAGDDGVCLTLSVVMTSKGASTPTLELQLDGRMVASLHLNIDNNSELCTSFAHNDTAPLMYTLYHIQRGDGIWQLRCFDKQNAPLRLLTPPKTAEKPTAEWAVKAIPFPEYFSDAALHMNPYSMWGGADAHEESAPIACRAL